MIMWALPLLIRPTYAISTIGNLSIDFRNSVVLNPDNFVHIPNLNLRSKFSLRSARFQHFCFPVIYFSNVKSALIRSCIFQKSYVQEAPITVKSCSSILPNMCNAVLNNVNNYYYDYQNYYSRYSITIESCTFNSIKKTTTSYFGVDGAALRVIGSQAIKINMSTFRNCFVDDVNNKGKTKAGATFIQRATNVAFDYVTAVGCKAIGDASEVGGFYFSNNNEVSLTNMNITSCEASFFSAMCCYYTSVKIMFTIVRNCVGDTVIQISQCTTVVDHITFYNNSIPKKDSCNLAVFDRSGQTTISNFCLFDTTNRYLNESNNLFAIYFKESQNPPPNHLITIERVNLPLDIPKNISLMFGFNNIDKINYRVSLYQTISEYKCYLKDFTYVPGTQPFTYSNTFPVSGTANFTLSHAFSYSDHFSESSFFSESSNFSESFLFTESRFFTESKRFSQSNLLTTIMYSSTDVSDYTSSFDENSSTSSQIPPSSIYSSPNDKIGILPRNSFIGIVAAAAVLLIIILILILFLCCRRNRGNAFQPSNSESEVDYGLSKQLTELLNEDKAEDILAPEQI